MAGPNTKIPTVRLPDVRARPLEVASVITPAVERLSGDGAQYDSCYESAQTLAGGS